MNYASVRVIEKELCKKEYLNYTGMDLVIDHFMLCTLGKGLLDDTGKIIVNPDDTQDLKQNGCEVRASLSIHDILVSMLSFI